MKKSLMFAFIFSLIAVTLPSCTKTLKESGLGFILSSDKTYYSVKVSRKMAGSLLQNMEVVIPEKYKGLPVKKVEDGGFFQKRIISLYLPDTVEEIGESAFGTNSSLKTIRWSNNLKIIKARAFEGCFELNGDIKLPESLETIGEEAFCSCKNANYFLGKNVSSIGNLAFKCNHMVNLRLSNDNPYYKMSNGVLFTYDEETLIRSNHDEPNGFYSIPNTVKKVSDYAFYGSSIQSLVISDNVTYVGDYAFSYCNNLHAVVLSKGLVRLSTGMFFNCDSLSGIDIPNNIQTICENALAKCQNLKSVTLNVGLKRIARYGLSSPIENITSLPEGIEVIEDYSFPISRNLTSFTLPISLKQIGHTFGSVNLEELIIPIGNEHYHTTDGILYDSETGELVCCPSGKEGTVIIEDGTKILTSDSFSNCYKITNLYLPNTLISVSGMLFLESLVNANIYYAGTMQEWNNAFIGTFYGNKTIIHCQDGDITYEQQYLPLD